MTKNKFVASAGRVKFHDPKCDWAQQYILGSQGEIWFKSAKEAKERGHKPCKTCNPAD